MPNVVTRVQKRVTVGHLHALDCGLTVIRGADCAAAQSLLPYPGADSCTRPTQVCASKLGDDAAGKNQFDPRLPEHATQQLKAEIERMRSTHTVRPSQLQQLHSFYA